jgi:hypothetical protein
VRLAKGGRLEADIAAYDYPASAKQTVKLGKTLAAADFDITAPKGANEARVRVIGVIENQAPTRALEADLAVEDGLVAMDRRNDVCQIALVERHRGTGAVVNGFVSGFGYTQDEIRGLSDLQQSPPISLPEPVMPQTVFPPPAIAIGTTPISSCVQIPSSCGLDQSEWSDLSPHISPLASPAKETKSETLRSPTVPWVSSTNPLTATSPPLAMRLW